CLMLATPLYALPADATGLTVALEKHRQDIEFLNICISNLPETTRDGEPNALRDELVSVFGQALQREYHAHLWLVRNDYGHAHAELTRSRQHLADAYQLLLERYLSISMALLDVTAPDLTGNRDAHARHYIQQGFVELESARLSYQRAMNIAPGLLPDQILYHRQGILHVRRSRRFALLAIIEAHTSREEKERYRPVSLDQSIYRRKWEARAPGEADFNRILYWLVTLIERGTIERTISTRHLPEPVGIDILEVHQDNYNLLIANRESVLNQLVADLDRSLFYEEQVLPARNRVNRDTVDAANSDPVPPRTGE
ncbi:MAG: hypothetical protein KDK34_22345, partial [Leptospiraceae bacterium]|nr:hypothetical protein [Leptospiraceae bacterium]